MDKIIADFKSVSNSEFFQAFAGPHLLLKSEEKRGSNKKSCPECLKNTKGEKTHCFHSGDVMSTVGNGPKLVIGFEMYKPGQDAVAKAELIFSSS